MQIIPDATDCLIVNENVRNFIPKESLKNNQKNANTFIQVLYY